MTREYISVAEAKALIGLSGDDETWDAHITKLIEAVCQAIDFRCKRTFAPASGDSVRYFHTRGGRIAQVDDFTSLTSLYYDDSMDRSYGQELTDDTDFICQPQNELPYRWVELLPGGDLDKFPVQQYALKITATWQYASEVPDIVKTACEILVTRLFKRKDTSFATIIASGTFDAMEIYRGMDPDAAMLLEPVSRKRIVIR